MGSSSEDNNFNHKEEIMDSDNKQVRSLREIELEVLEEGREWTRRRQEHRHQQEADRQGGVFPPQRSKGPPSAKTGNEPAHRRRGGRVEGMAGQGPDR